MFSIAICDDNHVFLEYEKELVVKMLSEITNKYKCDSYHSGEELITTEDRIRTYDLIILDCKMNELDGVKTAERIRAYNSSVKILFITEYYEYSFDACNVEAIGYILKNSPDFEFQLLKKIKRVYEDVLSREDKYITDFSDGVFKVCTSDIIYICSSSHYLLFYIKPSGNSQKVVVHRKRAKISDVIDMLDSSFVRVSYSYVVNLEYATSIVDSSILLRCESFEGNIPIKRGEKAYVEERFNKYYGAIKW